MAKQEVVTINITQADFDEYKDANLMMKVLINYYDDVPKGYEILFVKDGGTENYCARPCPYYHAPSQ